ncbi:MAG: alkaline phosphatase [Desulfobacterales bacterium]|jgi:alkaline phosphatase|nr:alkaline phosphatase [Desulfobacterales bacterium]
MPCRRSLAALLTCLLLIAFSGATSPAEAAAPAKNLIVLIADGCASEQHTFARWFKGAPLAYDPYQVGAIQTFIADSVIADSAPAASAFATGVRTSDKFISVGPNVSVLSTLPQPSEELRYRPLATVLEGAKLLKKATGIVATSRVTHATPAAYAAHTDSRDAEDDIMEQLVHQGVDVVFGGGKRHLLPKAAGGRRTDGKDLLARLAGWGYQLVETREELMRVRAGRVFGMFAASHMDPEIDRPRSNPGQPTLEEMTRKAIEILAQDEDGFFLMVEGSQIDWACHANDPAYLLSDLLAFDRAASAALDFARADGRTLVLVMSDHNTGGFSIGGRASEALYTQLSVEALLEPFRKMKQSAYAMWAQLGKERTVPRLQTALREGWGLDITEPEARAVLERAAAYKTEGHAAIGAVLCPIYTHVGWTTHGHTGGDVPLFAYGPGKPGGVLDAPRIAHVCADALGLDLARLNERLFVEASGALPYAAVALDTSDPANPVVAILARGQRAELWVNRNLLKFGERLIPLEGVVVHAAKTGRVYLPMQAVHLIQGKTPVLPPVAK